MEMLLEFARGPVFRLSFTLMILGLLRLIILHLINAYEMFLRSNRRPVPIKQIIKATTGWLIPFNRSGLRTIFILVSFIFHITVIITPFFLSAHILLWERGVGISYPAMSQAMANCMTLIAIVTSLVLFLRRIFSKAARELSSLQDFLIPLLVLIIFLTGFLAMHPRINPINYNSTMLMHVMSGNIIFILIPFTKLSHVVLFWETQFISEMGWHFDTDSVENVTLSLGKEEEPV